MLLKPDRVIKFAIHNKLQVRPKMDYPNLIKNITKFYQQYLSNYKSV